MTALNIINKIEAFCGFKGDYFESRDWIYLHKEYLQFFVSLPYNGRSSFPVLKNLFKDDLWIMEHLR
jgi:hypothetical protein